MSDPKEASLGLHPEFKNILFDLDGTITDSSTGIINAYMYSLNKIGLFESDMDVVKSYIGSPLRAYFTQRHNLNDNDSETAVKFFREYYTEKGLFENNVYPGMAELLAELHSKAYQVFIATSKPEIFARRVLSHFKIDKYFSYIKGSDMSADNKPKQSIINDVLTVNNLDKNESIMIGDRYHDINGAKLNNINSIAVTYGYGSLEELQKENPTYFASNTYELKSILL